MPGVGKYKDVGKKAKDLLKDNFDVTGNNALKVVNKTANGVEFTTEGKIGGAWSSSLKFSPADGVTVKKFKADTKGRFYGEATLDDAFVKGLQFSINFEDGANAGSNKPKALVGLTYGTDDFHLAADGDFANVDATVLNTAVNVNVPVDGLTAGATFSFNTTSSSLDSYATRFDYAASDMTFTAESGQGLGNTHFSVFHKYDADTNVAASVVANRGLGNVLGLAEAKGDASTKMTIGATSQLDKDSSIGAKIDCCNNLGLFYTQKMNSSVSLTAAAKIDVGKWTSNDGHSAGLKFTFK